MTPEEAEIRDAAIAFAKKNKQAIAMELTVKETFPADQNPVSVFMAGSPGAGKTEASKALIREVGGTPTIRIGPDELRERFEAYDGGNSWLFHPAASILVVRFRF